MISFVFYFHVIFKSLLRIPSQMWTIQYIVSIFYEVNNHIVHDVLRVPAQGCLAQIARTIGTGFNLHWVDDRNDYANISSLFKIYLFFYYVLSRNFVFMNLAGDLLEWPCRNHCHCHGRRVIIVRCKIKTMRKFVQIINNKFIFGQVLSIVIGY